MMPVLGLVACATTSDDSAPMPSAARTDPSFVATTPTERGPGPTSTPCTHDLQGAAVVASAGGSAEVGGDRLTLRSNDGGPVFALIAPRPPVRRYVVEWATNAATGAVRCATRTFPAATPAGFVVVRDTELRRGAAVGVVGDHVAATLVHDRRTLVPIDRFPTSVWGVWIDDGRVLRTAPVLLTDPDHLPDLVLEPWAPAERVTRADFEVASARATTVQMLASAGYVDDDGAEDAWMDAFRVEDAAEAEPARGP